MDLRKLGALLREERERRSLSLDDVSNKIKISKTCLAAIEEGDEEKLPHPVYAKGFIRNYARLLDMGPGPFEVAAAPDYFTIIREQGKVVLDARERESLVRGQAERLAREAGGSAVINPSLLVEVTGLTEHPVVILGRFDRKFLAVPREVLITSMLA